MNDACVTLPASSTRQRRRLALDRRLYALLVGLCLVALLVSPLQPAHSAGRAVAGLPGEQAAELLAKLSAEERVGQLFLVSFNGTQVGPETPIFELVSKHYIGGVILRADYDNFPAEDTPAQTLQMNRQLQTNRWSASQLTQTDPVSGSTFSPAFIPLFIGLAQEGDGYPYDQILSGLTSLPNQMAIGATWNPNLAAQVGAVVGREMAALGFNMLFGPSLDVLETPHTEAANDLGTRTFGGDPFWVGEMGRAFVQGVHQGSQNRLATIATHFPGHGSSDRLPEEEVATVRKSLDQLRRFDLVPFFSVTETPSNPQITTDGLLTSHIRYQGFQDSSRGVNRPLSFDPATLGTLMNLPVLDAWRKSGGVMVSDNLGSRAVRGYYGLTSQTFDARRVTLNAFLAGNDLLYVADFTSTSEPDAYTAAVRTIEYFTQKYREDPAFAQRVDEAVLRILTLKFRLFGEFSLEGSAPAEINLADLGQASSVTFEVARQAATLISPSQANLEETLPDPPNGNDRLIFITDTRSGQQCSTCPAKPLLGVRALQDVVLRRYGPQAGLVSGNNLTSFSLDNLQAMLDGTAGGDEIEQELQRAHWVVFAMLANGRDAPSYHTLARFLAERPDLFQQKRLIVFAFGAPYYLDGTNIAKLSAYYALYSKAPPFVDMAAYLLFQELPAAGALPVSVPGISYDLNTALFPDPNQTIPLELDLPREAVTTTATVEPTPVVEFRMGDMIPIRTGVILDSNGNPVPDGTPVEFILSLGGAASAPIQVENTRDGIARTTFLVTTAGTIEIRAQSELAKSEILRFDIPLPNTNGEALTPTPTQTPTPTPTEMPTPTPTLTTSAPPVAPPPPERPQFGDWVMAVFIAAGIATLIFRLSAALGQVRWGVRSAFLALIGSLLAYSYLALELPGATGWLEGSVSRGVFLVTLTGAVIGLAIALSWRAVDQAGRREAERTH